MDFFAIVCWFLVSLISVGLLKRCYALMRFVAFPVCFEMKVVWFAVDMKKHSGWHKETEKEMCHFLVHPVSSGL